MEIKFKMNPEQKNIEKYFGPAYHCPICKRIKVGKRLYRPYDETYQTIKKQYEDYMFDEPCPRDRGDKKK